MSWKVTTKEKPKLTRNFKNSDGFWQKSELVLAKFKNPKGNKPRYSLLEYEKGEGWEQWYDPESDDATRDPESWMYIPKEKVSHLDRISNAYDRDKS